MAESTLETYLREINRYSLLTREEEVDAFRTTPPEEGATTFARAGSFRAAAAAAAAP